MHDWLPMEVNMKKRRGDSFIERQSNLVGRKCKKTKKIHELAQY